MEWTPPPDGIAANVLNRVVNERYLNARSILITTNKRGKGRQQELFVAASEIRALWRRSAKSFMMAALRRRSSTAALTSRCTDALTAHA